MDSKIHTNGPQGSSNLSAGFLRHSVSDVRKYNPASEDDGFNKIDSDFITWLHRRPQVWYGHLFLFTLFFIIYCLIMLFYVTAMHCDVILLV